MSWQTWLNVRLGWLLRYQSSNLPERGHSGAVVWLCTVTESLVRWNAGKRITGAPTGAADAGADAETELSTRASTARATPAIRRGARAGTPRS
ncbi:hypothetical protein GCM10023317_64480 [Actinopolymorpha pittospori]